MMRGGVDRTRSQMTAEIRRLMEQDMNRFFRQLNAEVVKDSGGMVKLHKVLEGRGLTFAEWQMRLQKKAFTQSYLHQILKPRAPDPGPRQIQSYYADHPDEFARPGAVRFRHIFFSNAKRGPEQARDDAIAVWERLVDEEISFEDAAKEHSDDPESRARGGLETEEEARDPEREAWLADIRTALREENPGEVGPILESPFGCHVAELIAVGPQRKVPFAEVRGEIEQKLMGRIWEEEADRYFAAIRQKTDIRVLQPAFPASLSCAALANAHGAGRPRVYSTAYPEVLAPRGGER
jgi:parvulin-like peptidyl-prolyl isomerase